MSLAFFRTLFGNCLPLHDMKTRSAPPHGQRLAPVRAELVGTVQLSDYSQWMSILGALQIDDLHLWYTKGNLYVLNSGGSRICLDAHGYPVNEDAQEFPFRIFLAADTAKLQLLGNGPVSGMRPAATQAVVPPMSFTALDGYAHEAQPERSQLAAISQQPAPEIFEIPRMHATVTSPLIVGQDPVMDFSLSVHSIICTKVVCRASRASTCGDVRQALAAQLDLMIDRVQLGHEGCTLKDEVILQTLAPRRGRSSRLTELMASVNISYVTALHSRPIPTPQQPQRALSRSAQSPERPIRMCRRCGLPVDNLGCNDLKAHHGWFGRNRCTRCGWFDANYENWPLYDNGELDRQWGSHQLGRF